LPRPIERRAAAKVNLALHVLGRRPDGYHELDTLVVFADIGDRLEVAAADRLTLSLSGPFAAHAPPGSENLAFRAAILLKGRGPGSAAAIGLEKNLPAGAGFGGGSADAAATFAALNDLWGLRLGHDELAALGRKLGADVPMCLHGAALRARGSGDEIEPVPGWPALPLVLVWPGRPVSTAAAFAALSKRTNPPLPDPPRADMPAELARFLAACRNDLEQPALDLVPEIAEALDAIRTTKGCLLARMSGSGSGCFGLYPDRTTAERGAASVSERQPDWWVMATEAR
jgi:4-diphosphocytidyl-2-C-methyl-D-erythritol kinase